MSVYFSGPDMRYAAFGGTKARLAGNVAELAAVEIAEGHRDQHRPGDSAKPIGTSSISSG